MKSLSKALLAVYSLFLLWIVLFKSSVNLISVISDYQKRSLNLVPFAGVQGVSFETIANFVIFIPLGLLLSANLKRTRIWRKLALVFFLSLAVEITQYVFAIGSTDITDVIMNTSGGFVGLVLYRLSQERIKGERQDRFILVAVTILLILFMVLRFFVFRVRY